MNFKSFFIERIEIENFKKISDFSIDLSNEVNIFFGGNRSGKTSLCEFIQFMLYGADSIHLAAGDRRDIFGKLTLCADGEIFSLTRTLRERAESFSLYSEKEQKEVTLSVSPGKYFTGLDLDSFDTVCYFRQSRFDTLVCKPEEKFLAQIAASREESKTVYTDFNAAQESVNSFRNDSGSGMIDRFLTQKSELLHKLNTKSEVEETIEKSKATLEDICARIEENDRKIVLLKADMMNYSDDVRLVENRKNAEELQKEIRAKEKKLNLLSFEISQKTAKLDREELEELKNDYNQLSLAITRQSDAQNFLTTSEENLFYHKKLFTGKESLPFYENARKKILFNKKSAFAMKLSGGIFLLSAFIVFFALYFNSFGFIPSAALSGACILTGIAAFCLSGVFSTRVKKILSETDNRDLSEFSEFYDKLCAHAKTTLLYREEIQSCRTEFEKAVEKTQKIQRMLALKLHALGFSDSDGDLLAICDDIIEKNSAVFDLEEDLMREKARYRALLGRDVQRGTLQLSSDFFRLQKELDFVTKQNDSLNRKKANQEELLRRALQNNPDVEALKTEIAKIDMEMAPLVAEFEAANRALSKAEQKKKEFEWALRAELSERINKMLSRPLLDGESYSFDDSFSLCYQDKETRIPLSNLGGGGAELGVLAFRLSLAEMLGKTGLPMIFDDTFASFDKKTIAALYEVLRETCSQIFLATSSTDLAEICQDSAKMILL